MPPDLFEAEKLLAEQAEAGIDLSLITELYQEFPDLKVAPA